MFPRKQFFNFALEKVEHFFNPSIGKQLINSALPRFLVRMDGRSHFAIAEKNGFPSVLTTEQQELIRRDSLDQYQSSNRMKFGIGACASYSDLERGYIAGNLSFANQNHLYGFYSKGVCINGFRAQVIGEENERGYENEIIVLEQIPQNAILFSTEAKDREKFNAGLQVPNVMAELNPNLPDRLCKNDVEDAITVLNWLFENNAEEAAKEMCTFLYKDFSASRLAIHFANSANQEYMIGRVLHFLEKENSPDPLSSLS